MNSGDDNTGARSGAAAVNPWEERKDRGRVSALIACLVLLATSPRRFFEGTRADAGIWGPLLFLSVVAALGFLLNGVVLTVLTLTAPEPALEFVYRMELWGEASMFAGSEELPFGPTLSAIIILQVILLFLPVIFAFTLIFTPFFGALVHLLLILTRTPRSHGFRGTWAAMCYANGASLVGIVPIAGDILGVVCTAALFALGLHVVQGVGVIRAAVLASILPLLLFLSLLLPRGMEAAAF